MTSKAAKERKVELLELEVDLANCQSVLAASRQLRNEVRASGRWPNAVRAERAPRVATMLNEVLVALDKVRTWRGRIFHRRWEHCSDAFPQLDDVGKKLRNEKRALRRFIVPGCAD